MKKSILPIALIVMLLLGLVSCVSPSPVPMRNTPADTPEAPDTPEVSIVDSDGKTVKVKQNPKTAAIYDYGVLDILNNIGFEKTGIERLVIPSKETLPDDLSFYKEKGGDKVVAGGTLFYVDWDVLDLIQPELVILGGRSFGMNSSGDRLEQDDSAKFRDDTEARYAKTAFAKITVSASDSNFFSELEGNVEALSQIFPSIAYELQVKLDGYRRQVADIHQAASVSGKKALFAMTPEQTTISVFNPASRYDILYSDFGFSPAVEGADPWSDSHGFDVRAEYILEADPDVIFLLDRSAAVGSGAGANNFLKDPIIAKTEASKNDNIYILHGDAWYLMTGGFTALEKIIEDISQYTNTLK
ncbi:MAG: ABC transporter substrate-binding protein [Oscillospiraceae bacterium]|nr:ABC transporter substrate-binding protein [Oscillospiraceae bacterium]